MHEKLIAEHHILLCMYVALRFPFKCIYLELREFRELRVCYEEFDWHSFQVMSTC